MAPNKFKKRNIFAKIKDAQILLALFIIIILQIPVAYGQIKNWYNNSLNEHNYKAKKIEKLETGVNFDYFKQILGEPVVSLGVKIGETDLKEDYFIDRLFYVQAISTSSGTVIYYAVTTRSYKFNPKIMMPDGSKTIILGKSRLSDYHQTDFLSIVSKQHSGLNEEGNFYYEMGAHDFNYYERYYLANPGNYQVAYIGINDMGAMEFNSSYVDKGSWAITSEDISKFRQTNAINTYAETAPLINGLDTYKVNENDPVIASGRLGVDKNIVRVFNF